jgi:molybdopterin/thiamine biosynthesis adenylyltransferase
MANKTTPEWARYQRQLIIKDFGVKGQRKLSKTKALIAGAGGLGSVISLYLTAAGVGKIGILDNDKIDISNLNRQVLYDTRDTGKSKAETAAEKLRKLNPDIEVVAINRTLTDANAAEIAKGYDIIVDAMDNFETRFVLNRLALKQDLPFFHGAVEGFEGRVTTIIPGRTPCFACIYPFSPPKKVVPVLGTTPAVVGSLQATEVIKYITGLGELLLGKLLIYEGLSMEFMTVNLRRREDCQACSTIKKEVMHGV